MKCFYGVVKPAAGEYKTRAGYDIVLQRNVGAGGVDVELDVVIAAVVRGAIIIAVHIYYIHWSNFAGGVTGVVQRDNESAIRVAIVGNGKLEGGGRGVVRINDKAIGDAVNGSTWPYSAVVHAQGITIAQAGACRVEEQGQAVVC